MTHSENWPPLDEAAREGLQRDNLLDLMIRLTAYEVTYPLLLEALHSSAPEGALALLTTEDP